MAREDSIMPGVRLLAAISAGGVLGALARYGLQSVFPHGASAFGWATLTINKAGALAAILAARTMCPPRSFSVVGAVFALRSRRGERSCSSPTMPSPR